jgi:hypothetical protein
MHCPAALQVWQAVQVLLHTPVAGSHVWQGPQLTGTQVLLAELQVWQAGQPPLHCPVVGSHF